MGLPSRGEPGDPPFVLVEKVQGAVQISALDACALRNKLAIGMSLGEARALMPHIAAAPADGPADTEYLRAAAAACEMFTPLVALHGPDGLILDITGCAHLFGGEECLISHGSRRLTSLGITTRASIACTPDAAWAFARFADIATVPPGCEARLARNFPITALECDAETRVALMRAGLKTLGELVERPSTMLAARFGSDLVTKLHRILGHEDIRIAPLRALPDYMAEKHFPEPFGAMDGILAVLERLAHDIAGLLERQAEGGRGFEASFFRADGQVRRLTIETAQGTRDPPSLVRLFKLRIEALADPIDPGFGFDAVRLAVTRSEKLHERQKTLEGGHEPGSDQREIAELADRLAARFGRGNVLRFGAEDTHDPVRAAGTMPYLSAAKSADWPKPEPGNPPCRPLTMFTPPQLIDALAEVPDGPPLRFRWRRVLHEVARAEGPERIAPEWWRGGGHPPATRDYYRVENAAGHRFWIFREGFYEDSTVRPRWFLHGLFA